MCTTYTMVNLSESTCDVTANLKIFDLLALSDKGARPMPALWRMTRRALIARDTLRVLTNLMEAELYRIPSVEMLRIPPTLSLPCEA
jgi:hypothetical protein